MRRISARIFLSFFCLFFVNSLLAQNTPSPNFGGLLVAPTYSTGGSINGPVYNATFGLATGDFNHDGLPDLAVVTTGGQINVLLNDGKGGLKAPLVSTPGITLPGSNIPAEGQVLAADLNGDGYDDVVIGIPMQDSPEQALYVLLNQRNGTFSTATPLSVSQNFPYLGYVFYFALGQTTSSGHTDIVLVEPQSNRVDEYTGAFIVTSFLNDGAGNFSVGPKSTLLAPNGTYVGSREAVTLADANHDGKLDFFLLYFDNLGNYDVAVGLGNGDGSFQTSPPVSTVSIAPTNPWEGPQDLAVADLTGDQSKQDILIAEPDGVAVALSNGDGTYQSPVVQVPYQYGSGLKTADLNGDGKPDLLLSQSGTLSTYLGNGDGTFGAASGTYTADALNYMTVALGLPYPASIDAVADFDGDGHLDFAVADSQTALAEIAHGNGDGTFDATPVLTPPAAQEIPSTAIIASAVVDLNGDGLDDFVSAGPITALADGKGGFQYSNISNPAFPYALEIRGDFNGDGKEDVVLGGSDHTVAIALSNGDGTLKAPVVVPFGMTLACNVGQGTVGDLNGDGKVDLVIPYGGDAGCTSGSAVSSGFFVALGKGDGTFQQASFYPFGSYAGVAILGSFHGRSAPLDLVVGDLNGMGIWILSGKGDGTFGTPTEINSTQVAYQILADDFNQDGNADVTLLGYSLPKVTSGAGVVQMPGNGDGTFATGTELELGEQAHGGVYADMNGDGVPDFVASSDDGLSVRLGTGGGSFASPIPYFSPYYTGPVLAGNFLGDNTQSLLIYGDYFYGIGGGTGFYKNLGGTSLAAVPSASSITFGDSLSLTATLTATLAGRPAPSGTITFLDGTTAIGNTAVGGTVTTSSLAVGSHSITVAYSGDANFNPNTSVPVAVTVAALPPDFTIAPSAATLTVTKGQSGTLTLTVTPNATLSGSSTFSCTGLPSEAACSFSPATLSVAAGVAGTATVTVSTKAASSSAVAKESGMGLVGIFAAVCVVVILPKTQSRWVAVVIVALGLGALAGLGGCGGGSSPPITPTDPGTPTGNSSVTVSATVVSGSTSVTHSTTFTLTVQ